MDEGFCIGNNTHLNLDKQKWLPLLHHVVT